MSKRVFYSVAMITMLFSIAMLLFPKIDLAISSWFYQPQSGFLLSNKNYIRFHLELYRDLLVYITYGFMIALALMLIGGILFKKLTMPLSPKVCLFLLVCFVIAPLLIVNIVLKDHWGRARPFQVQQFGGDKIFTPAWVVSTQCERNCSFTSGETANVFCYLALIFIVRRKKLVASIVLTLGALTALERIAQGEHFFSDAILSGLLDYLFIWVVYRILEKNYYFYPILGEKNVRTF